MLFVTRSLIGAFALSFFDSIHYTQQTHVIPQDICGMKAVPRLFASTDSIARFVVFHVIRKR